MRDAAADGYRYAYAFFDHRQGLVMSFESSSFFPKAAMPVSQSPDVLSIDAAGALYSVDVKVAAAMQDAGALLLDVREPHEHALGHAPGSVLIPLGQLERRLQEIARFKERPVALICRSGRRSFEAQKILVGVGFDAAVNVEGGMIAWQSAGLPVMTGSPAP